MRIVYPLYGIDIKCDENKVIVLTIESPRIMRKMAADIWCQTHGGEGDWRLIENGNEIKISKSCELITNPFSLDINEKKVLSQLYKEIKDSYSSDYTMKLYEVHRELLSLVEDIGKKLPYPIIYQDDFTLDMLFQIIGLRIDTEYMNEMEQLINYVCLKNKINQIRCYFVLNPRQFFEKPEMRYLYEKCIYEKINLIMLQGFFTDKIDFEEHWILDKDMCIIEI